MRIKGVEEPFEGLAFWVWAVYIFIYCVATPVEAVSQFKKTKQINTPKINNLSQMVKKKKSSDIHNTVHSRSVTVKQKHVSSQAVWVFLRQRWLALHSVLRFYGNVVWSSGAKRRHFIFHCAWLIIQSSTDDEQTHNVHSQTQICYIYKNTRKHKCSLLYINRTQYNFVGWMQRC